MKLINVLSNLVIMQNTPKEYVLAKRPKATATRNVMNYWIITFPHKFFKNDIEKLVTQTKEINTLPSSTEEGAWINAALKLLNIKELDSNDLNRLIVNLNIEHQIK